MATDWSGAPKDPQDVRDYGIDWSADIGAATIVASTWSIVSGTITIVLDDFETTATTVRLAGGTAGESVQLRNHVILSDGQEADQTGTIDIQER